MKKSILIILLMSACIVRAQQIPLYNQYYINPFVYNPAFTGTSGNSNVYLIHRNQWQDFPGAPVTSALTFDSPVQKDKIGIGFILSNDQAGIIARTEAMGTMSYRARMTAQQSFLFGLSVGVLDNHIDFASIKVLDPTEASLLAQSSGHITQPNATFGIAYQFNRLELGISVPQLFASKLPYVNQVDARTYYTLVRHFIGSAKYTFDVDRQRNITAYPLVLLRTASGGVPTEIDACGVLDWANIGWLGMSYRSDLSIGFNLGVKYKGFTLGYVYEVPTGAIATYAGNSSEILLGYTFGKHQEVAEDKLDQIMKKLDNIEKQNKGIKNRLDSLENRVNRIQFERADKLKREVQVGDVFVLKNVNFEYKSYKLTDQSFDILDELVSFLNNNPTIKIAIYGHTDDVANDEYNDKLSTQRAKAVYDYLLEGTGISSSRLSYKGFGKRQPLVNGTSERARAKNRRVEFKIISK